MGSKVNGINQIGSAERHPEKAGVGGSSPSLATTFSSSYSHLLSSVCSILFQFQNQACRNLPRTQNGSHDVPPGLAILNSHQPDEREARYTSMWLSARSTL